MSGDGVHIGVLGPVLATADNAPILLRSAQQRLLLAVLVAAGGRTVQPHALAEALWADAIPADPTGALQSQISRLRRRLGPAASWLATATAGYRLVCPTDHVDALRFERLLNEARGAQEEPSLALGHLDDALALWRGRAYLEVADHPSIAAEATRLDEARADATELRAELLLRLGRPAQAASAMRAHIDDHPFRERPVLVRMRALAQEGRHAEALAEFERFRRLLDEELGLEPSPELRAVEQAILRHEQSSQALAGAIGLPGNSFIGRDAEVSKAAFLLEHGRLVTITGPGGVGKTRVALHTATSITSDYPDGVYLCELARVSDPTSVPNALASTLHVEGRADRSLTDRLIEFLKTKRALLVIDNCEHLAPEVGRLISAIITRTPDVDILATSRERLGVEGEELAPIGPLATPAWDDPSGASVALFIDRARGVRPDLTPTTADVATVCELCRRLDGLPLAIELAAAQTVSRTPQEILVAVTDRLEDLSDRRRIVERHRSLDAVFSWSYELLDDSDRLVFEQLATFTGGFTADAAYAVAAASTGDLNALVEHSLLGATSVGRDTRFSMLEPVRQYAMARLDESDATAAAYARHAAWAVDFLEAADAGLCGPDVIEWRRALEDESANLRAAHRWCFEHDPASTIRFAGSLYNYLRCGAASEVFTWAEEAIARFPDVRHRRSTIAAAAAAAGAALRGDLSSARALARMGISTAQERTDARFALSTLGDVENFLGNFEEALPYYDHAIALAQQVGDDYQAGISSCDRAMSMAYVGRFYEAIEACEQLSSIVAAVASPALTAYADYANGEVRLDHAPLEALPFLRRSVATARRIGDRLLTGLAGLSAVSCEARVGDPSAALLQYADLIDHWHRAGAWNMQWATLRTLIELLARLGRYAEAAVLYGAMSASSTAPPVAGADTVRIADAVRTARSRLGAEVFDSLEAEGRALSDNDAVSFALEHVAARPGRADGGRPSELTAT